jgi:hypothetical protein
MTDLMQAPAPQGELAPVRRRGLWIAWGLALQMFGVGIPGAAALERANHDGALGTLTHYTFRLVLHEMLRSRADIALIALGVVVFAAGSVVLARPFVRRRLTLFVAVPVAAVAGVAVLGLIAVVIAAIAALAATDSGGADLIDGLGWSSGGDRRRRR